MGARTSQPVPLQQRAHARLDATPPPAPLPDASHTHTHPCPPALRCPRSQVTAIAGRPYLYLHLRVQDAPASALYRSSKFGVVAV
jgi:hypothetical protein